MAVRALVQEEVVGPVRALVQEEVVWPVRVLGQEEMVWPVSSPRAGGGGVCGGWGAGGCL